MKKDKEYIIQFKGLSEGIHKFKYSVGSKFFSMIENPMYDDGNILVEVTLDKRINVLILDFCMKGYVSSVCDNCLEPINVTVSNSERIYIKFGDTFEELSENSLIIPHSEYEIEISKIIYDIIVTSLPMRHLHEYDENGNVGCDPEMLKKIKEHTNKNSYNGNKSKNQTDPRWDKLKNIIEK